MKDRISSGVFSLSGASIIIGVIGFFSSIVTMFVNVNDQISIKWLLFSIVAFTSLTLLLLKVIHDLSKEIKPPPPYENPIRYIQDETLFVIRRNENFVNHIVVGCYIQKDDIDRLAYLGEVYLVQEKVIQIKVLRDFGVITSTSFSFNDLKSIVIRPVVPTSAFQQMEQINE